LANIGELSGDETEDSWSWRPGKNGDFSISSAYKVIEKLLVLDGNLNSLEKGCLISFGGVRLPQK